MQTTTTSKVDAAAMPLSGAGKWLVGTQFRPFRRFAISVAVLCLLFILPLIDWVKLALKDDLHSHTILVPFIAAYLAWNKKDQISDSVWAPMPVWLASFAVLAAGALFLPWICQFAGNSLSAGDRLVALILGLYACILTTASAFLGLNLMKLLAFPAGLLIFMVPLPHGVVVAVETLLKHASADASEVLFNLCGTSFLRDGLFFMLPGLTIKVAQECSGIRSTMVLLITGMVAAYWYLNSPGKRLFLILATFPIGIIRNAIRIVLLSVLSVEVDPSIIHSRLHTSGGPIFFLVSLVPLFALTWLLRRMERSKQSQIAQ